MRLAEFDYSEPNSYFLTICTRDRKNLFWQMEKNERPFDPIRLTPLGTVVDQAICDIPTHYAGVIVENYVIMPNHIHMILVLPDDENRTDGARKSNSAHVSRIIHQLKSIVTKQYGQSIWQKSFYDHIIRGPKDYEAILNYIESNPERWLEDRDYGS